MPKAKSKRPTRPVRKAAREASKPMRKAVKPARQPAASKLDARVVAAISLALQDEETASARGEVLREGLSPWTALGRVRTLGKR